MPPSFQTSIVSAFGHIHRPQAMGGGSLIPEAGDGSDQSLSTAGLPLIRYCGTPLKYSFSEANHEKSITVVELGEKGKKDIRTIPLKPLRDMVELRGTLRRADCEKLLRKHIVSR